MYGCKVRGFGALLNQRPLWSWDGVEPSSYDSGTSSGLRISAPGCLHAFMPPGILGAFD